MQQPMGDRNGMSSSSDDTAMMRQIQGTHALDGSEVDVKPLLHIIEDILHRAAPILPGTLQTTQAQLDAVEDKAIQSSFSDMPDNLAYTISKISCEIACNCSGGGDSQATTLGLFKTLSSYSWDAKVVITLAAFAVNYGEFWLVAQLYPSNPLAKSVAILKKLPGILEGASADALKPRFEALTDLIKAMMDATKCIVEFKKLPSKYITDSTPVMVAANDFIPRAAYETIRSMACASQIMGLIGMDREHMLSTAAAWDLSSLAHKVNNIHKLLQNLLDRCNQYIDEKKYIEKYQTLERLFEVRHNDNLPILRALIYAKEDQLPLLDGKRRQVSIDLLRKKNVLLFISDLEPSNEEISILIEIYNQSREHPKEEESQYEVIWLPVIDRSTSWNENKQKQLESLQRKMPWYSVFNPLLLHPAVIKYIKDMWRFNKMPLLVVLDPQGKVVNPNAIHMMWIWGNEAFPFSRMREDTLWKKHTWGIHFLANNTNNPMLVDWVSKEKYICLYGGEDMKWIKEFTSNLQKVATDFPLEMLYVGKSNPTEKVKNNNDTIRLEELSHTLQDPIQMWFFWARLESMWHCKVQHGKSVESDPIMKEIMTLLSFDSSGQGWAVIFKGSTEMAKAKGDTILRCLEEREELTELARQNGFVRVLNDRLRKLKEETPHHCNSLILSGITGSIPEKMFCSDCSNPMEKLIMFRCCID